MLHRDNADMVIVGSYPLRRELGLIPEYSQYYLSFNVFVNLNISGHIKNSVSGSFNNTT